MKFILINGKKRSGKDYFAQLLQDELDIRGVSSEIISYADPIKLILAETFDISLDELEFYKNKASAVGIKNSKDRYTKVTNMRSVIQKFGTDAMKTWFGEDVWVEILLGTAKTLDADYIIIPDFRFKSEYIEDSITLNIVNDTNTDDCQTSQHISENELNDFDFDFVINNTGYSLTSKDAVEFLDKLNV
jgi:hypothetical protein